MTHVTPLHDPEELETRVILMTDLLARTAEKPMTTGNKARVHQLARKVMDLTADAPDAA